jgi:hypothetical protein
MKYQCFKLEAANCTKGSSSEKETTIIYTQKQRLFLSFHVSCFTFHVYCSFLAIKKAKKGNIHKNHKHTKAEKIENEGK